MKSFSLVFFSALAVSASAMPTAMRLSQRLGAMSEVGGRNVGVHSVGRLGGMGIVAGTMAALPMLLLTNSSVAKLLLTRMDLLLGMTLGALAMAALGLVDDVRRVRALHKFGVQILVGLFAYYMGFRIDRVMLPLAGELDFGLLAPAVTVVWIAGVVNAINLIDGLDGLAGGIVFFAALTNFAVGFVAGAVLASLYMAAIAGAVLGFLLYNWHPAKIYMGDSGSYFLGYVLATSSLLGAAQKASTTISILVPILAMGVPIFDTLFAMVRRVLERRPMFAPDRGHVHHRLLDMGMTQRRVVIGLYGVSILFTGLGVMVAFDRNLEIGLIIVGASGVALVIWGLTFGRRKGNSIVEKHANNGSTKDGIPRPMQSANNVISRSEAR
jgi:UDP-GlcNAc:undecaprenyl-phosphate GlcNAc-1-phosphate transferase